MTEETFNVGRIKVRGCERTIRMPLGDFEGIQHVDPDYRTNTVAVRFDEQRISRDAVMAQLSEIGYAPKEA